MFDREIAVVTGGLGFIGKHFVQRCLDNGWIVKNIDTGSYAADRKVGNHFSKFPNYKHVDADITTLQFLPDCDVLVNFAAESHVDNAIASARNFCYTNFLGVQNLLDLIRLKQLANRPLFIQISTDEVYGDISEGCHSESDMLIPSNPYSATKAAADMLVKSWGRTYGLEWNIIRPSNNYGMHQYPEKLIPRSAWRMMRGKPAIMHGDGSYIRSWLHVEDTVDAVITVINSGQRNTIYNIAGATELKNIEVLSQIADILEVSHNKAWTSVPDRSGQDIRYSVDDTLLRSLGWSSERNFQEELPQIVQSLDPARFD